jgi:hypothetical protein
VDDASPTSSRAWNSAPTSAVILAAILGAGLGAAVLYVDWWSWGKTDRTFAHSSSFILWASLICAQTTLWTLASVPVVATLRRHRNGWHSHRADIMSSSLLIVCLVAGIVAVSALQPQIPNVIPRSHWKVRGLTGVALLVALVASVSIWLIRGRLAELRAGAGKKELELYVQFRRDLERLLAFLGAVVGLAVLSSAALRRVVLAYAANGHPNADLPAEYPLLYGLILSLVVALIYLPTYLDLLEAGSNLRDRAAPLSEPNDPNFEAAVSKRKTLTDLLGLEVSASTSFRAGVTILTPLFAALVTLLPKFNS